MRFFRRLFCLIGIHKWDTDLDWVGTRGGYAIGYRCLNCKLWAKDTYYKAWGIENDEE
jgi:hypothetical protein